MKHILKKIPRNIMSALLPLTAVGLLLACSDEYVEGRYTASLAPKHLSLDKTSFTFSADAQSADLNVNAQDVAWNISNNAHWLSISPASGNSAATVAVSVQQNLSDTARTTWPQLTTSDALLTKSYKLTVSQDAAKPYINLSQESIEFDGSASTKIVTVESNYRWSSAASQSWITVTQTETGITVAATANNTDGSRSGYVTLTAGTLTKKINVVQRASNITSTISIMSFGNAAGTQSLSINADADWTSTAPAWIQLTPANGKAGTNNINITVTANNDGEPRKGYIYFYVGGTQKLEVAVEQTGTELSVSTTSLSFELSGGTQQLSITANSAWTLESTASWLHLSKTSGNSSDIISVSADNNGSASRNATITLKNGSGQIVSNINVAQSGSILSVQPNNISFGLNYGEREFYINADGDWTTSSDSPWLTLSLSHGTGNATVTAYVSENFTGVIRQGTITVKDINSNLEKTITVVQSTYTINADKSEIIFDPDGGTQTFNILTNSECLLEKPEWVELSDIWFNANKTVKVIVGTNYTFDMLSGEIRLKDSNGQVVQAINVTQMPVSASVNITPSSFAYQGGTAQLNISSNTSWKIASCPYWISLSQREGNGDTEIPLTILFNNTAIDRNGNVEVLFSPKNLPCTISITQIRNSDIGDFSYDLQHTFISKGETLSMAQIFSGSWTAEVTSGIQWIKLSSTSGPDSTPLAITCSENNSGTIRYGQITLTYNNGLKRYTIPIIQDGKSITLSKYSEQFFAKGGTSGAITITADKTATITPNASWIKVNQTNNSFTITTDANIDPSMRSGTITITLSDVTDAPTQTFSVKQAGVNTAISINGFYEDGEWF